MNCLKPQTTPLTPICLKLYLSCLLMLSGCVGWQPPLSKTPIKNVILVIGDGMGPQQVGLLLSYARQAPHSVLKNRRTAFDRLLADGGQVSISLTYPDNALVVDSAASASQLATSKFAGSEMIGLDKEGNPQPTLLEQAKQMGKAVGLVSDTRITHATPAAFAAHQSHRSEENDIANDLLASGADVMLSGGLANWLPQDVNNPSPLKATLQALVGPSFAIKSKRKDNHNLLLNAQQQGYGLVFTRQQLQMAQGKTLGLFANAYMANGLQEHQNQSKPNYTEPSLKDMAVQALALLGQNPKGFFLMIEGGQIDWAGHHNDTGLMLHEMLRFNAMLEAILNWQQGREDTLLIVTADHETGGFGFAYNNVNLPQGRYLPGKAFVGGSLFKPNFNFGRPDILDKLYTQQRSYDDILKEFDQLPEHQKTPAALANLVNHYTAFKISIEQAARVLATQVNPRYQPNQPESNKNAKMLPAMPSNSDFFVSGKENRENLLAQAVASQQNAVWATGTHTSTPVYVFSLGPKSTTQAFNKILHHTDVGQLMQQVLHLGTVR
jgi:alkaline phosphatase